MFRVVIPARFASSRFPGKALAEIEGKPMVARVYERARASQASEVIVATDDVRIESAARAFGADVVMTASSHESGTDRIAEVARLRGFDPQDVVVNVQGDEPRMPPELIDQVAMLLETHPQAQIATLASPLGAAKDLLDPNIVKVVTTLEGRALYFSRAPIPWHRDGGQDGLSSQTQFAGARRHIGLYAYRVGALLRIADLAPTALELAEKLEQLRALEHGYDIRVASAVAAPGGDVNTPEDLRRLASL